ncbi:DUF2927 domain-containing protein [Rhodobacteraceae bacterium NNCM2]|nr:DUF2927 domain-containing protein [Coraliihabitans acroporae]
MHLRKLQMPVLGLVSLAVAACATVTPPEYWRAFQASLKLDGKLRTERKPEDAPFDHFDLSENFGKTAFGIDPEFIDEMSEEQLDHVNVVRKWVRPIHYAAYGTIPPADRAVMNGLFDRLRATTGIPIDERPDGNWNMGIYFFDHLQRETFLDYLDTDQDADLYDLFSGLFSDDYICSGTLLRRTTEEGELTGEIDHVFIFIRAELPAALRHSCIEEEISQAMGLIRDDDDVRPSLFNEDEEFAFLTEHDEYLLRILYDPRILPGTRREDALPIARQIARELLPGPS